jgi:hypothetical protein
MSLELAPRGGKSYGLSFLFNIAGLSDSTRQFNSSFGRTWKLSVCALCAAGSPMWLEVDCQAAGSPIDIAANAP